MEQSNKSFKKLEEECHKKCLELEVERGASDDKRHLLYKKKLETGKEFTPEEEQWIEAAGNRENEITAFFAFFDKVRKQKYPSQKLMNELEARLSEI